MAAPMTPNSEMLYSYLNLDAFNTPTDTYITADGKDEDVFARAFGAHSNGELSSKSGLLPSTFLLRHNEQKSQYLSTTPPRSGGKASDISSTEFSNVITSQGTIPSSQNPSYLAHVLSSRRPNTVFSYENQYDPGYTLHPNTSDGVTGKQDSSEPIPFSGSYRDPFAAIPELPSELKLDSPNGNDRAQTPHSETSTQPPSVKTLVPNKVKKTRKRRNLRTAEEEAARHEAFLERNRKAAGKCRSKKKDRVQQLIWDMEASRSVNNQLKAEHWELLDEVSKLRAWALEHTKAAADGLCTALEAEAPQSKYSGGSNDLHATRQPIERKPHIEDSSLNVESMEFEDEEDELNTKMDTDADMEVEGDVDVDMAMNANPAQANDEPLEGMDFDTKETTDPVHKLQHHYNYQDEKRQSEGGELEMNDGEVPSDRDRVPSLDSSSGTIDSEGPMEEQADILVDS
ncbi:Cyclic AMP-dependent transcription factor ATF-2-like protein 1 [Phlyctema vagabunda]|uniref:Cyclic AMP-dependent transcription factor ATF-2-like protein 1 n=1 Tax=Phlyctema vagabunda TaxID=108571 RepID=A0ABR4PK21_9HELO